MGEGPCEEELQRTLEFDQACDHLEKGRYESSLLLLEKLGQESAGYKDVAELVAAAEVWLAATRRSCSCTTLHQNKNLDWYLILKVEENDGIGVIRRRYLQLALLLHPDKNKHPKAEGAFKLVSEAYRCLSDSKKRAVFDAYRSKITCNICMHKFGNLNDSCRSSVLGEVKSGQQLPKYWESSVDKNHHNTEKKSDDEKLQMFRERARARVDSMAQAWKERQTKLKEELKVKDVKFQCSSAGINENKTFGKCKYQSASYFRKTVHSDKQQSIGVPSCSDSDDGFTQFVCARNISKSRASSHFKEEKLEMPNYRKEMGCFAWSDHGKQIPFESMKNFAPKDLREIFRKQQTCVGEPSETSRNLKGFLQKLSDSRNGLQYHGSKLWSKTHGNKSFPVHYIYSEALQSDDEGDHSIDWYDNILKIDSSSYSVEKEHRSILRKQLTKESEFNLHRSSYCNPERHSPMTDDAENAMKPELVKTTEQLKGAAKGVAAILKKWKQGIVG